MARILVVDDEETICQTLTFVGQRAGHETVCARTLASGLQKATAEDFDVVLLDVRMPDGNGLEMLPKLAQTPSSPEIIIMTGFGDAQGAEMALNSGAWDYIEKGAPTKDITLSLMRALEYRKQKLSLKQNDVVALKRDNIIGSSPSLTRCLDQVARAAASDTTVLILGETGCGKELFARAVHQNSKRADRQFVVVDCASLPETLAESILFGHEKGAFTGAEKASVGLIGEADGGTLFLDEVGELPLTVQKAFLRVLQERRYRPVGGHRELESDFRLVAATNRNLDQMSEAGQFRSDLLFRLRSFVINLPPLRKRSEDIKELARHYMDMFCERNGMSPKGSCPDFMETLLAYDWPGNIREFVNTIERAVISARSEPVLFAQHLPTSLRIKVAQSAVRRSATSEAPCEELSPGTLNKLKDFRESVYSKAEKQYLQELMTLAKNDIPSACCLSGLSQSRLYALLKTHDLHRPE